MAATGGRPNHTSAGKVRKVPPPATAFNILGPLTNPARPTYAALGVADPTAAPLIAGVFAGLAFGLAPWEVYGHSPVTVASGLVGVALTGIGWLVCRWVLARALAPQVHR